MIRKEQHTSSHSSGTGVRRLQRPAPPASHPQNPASGRNQAFAGSDSFQKSGHLHAAWSVIGRILFWLSWPALFIWLYFTKRTRVLVISGDEVLVVRGWLSSGRWGLPGGGLHLGEEPRSGATRELNEETGIQATKDQLNFLTEKQARDDHGLHYRYIAFSYQPGQKPQLTRQKLELTNIEWINWHDLYKDPTTSADIKDIIAKWQTS